MKTTRTHCPLCFCNLEEVDVAPCHECGHRAREIEHALSGQHLFAELTIFGDLSLALCSFCRVDFGSWHGEFFGQPPGFRVGYGEMSFMRYLPEVFIGRDKMCPE